MEVVIYLLGFACIAYCTYFNLYTRHAINALKSMFQTYQLKYLAAIPAVVAVLFFFSSSGQMPLAFLDNRDTSCY